MPKMGICSLVGGIASANIETNTVIPNKADTPVDTF